MPVLLIYNCLAPMLIPSMVLCFIFLKHIFSFKFLGYFQLPMPLKMEVMKEAYPIALQTVKGKLKHYFPQTHTNDLL